MPLPGEQTREGGDDERGRGRDLSALAGPDGLDVQKNDENAHHAECYQRKGLAQQSADSAQEARAKDDWAGYRTMMDYATANAEAALNLRCSWAIALRVSVVQTTSGPILAAPSLIAG